MSFLSELRKSGFTVSLNNDNDIVISPVSKLSKEHRALIKKNKVSIVCELQLEKLYLHWHIVTETEEARFSVIPPSSLADIKQKFPKAKVITPIENTKLKTSGNH